MLLIDGDQLVYQIASASEYEYTITGNEWKDAWLHESTTALMSDGAQVFDSVLSKIEELSDSYDRAILCFSSYPNFRHDVLKEYKGGRDKTRKPLCYWGVIEQLTKELTANQRYSIKQVDGLEADDVMSILATMPTFLSKFEVTIWSQDKDMLQVPDITIIKPDGTTVRNTLEQANHFRWTQCLSGDRTDGYYGLPGVGPKTAEKILDGTEGSDESIYHDVVVQEYLDRGFSLDYAYSQIDCACILRADEYDYQAHRPILIKERVQ